MSDAPTIESQPQPQHLSPWMVIGGIALLAVLGAVALAILAAALTPAPSPVPEGVAQASLPDGSVLVLHGITDTPQLELPEDAPTNWEQIFERLFGGGRRTITFYGNSSGNHPLTLWFARYDAQTGKPLEFDRWSHCIITTPEQTDVWDLEHGLRVARQTQPHQSTSSTGSSRPFEDPLDPGQYSHILYSSNVPRVRSSSGEVEIDVYHADDGHIATLTAPLPGGPTSLPTWTPQPLPATAADGDVEVTLRSLSSQLRYDRYTTSGRPRHEVRVELDVAQDGEPSTIWSSQQVRLADELGNESHPYDCTISRAEAAWKVRARLFRSGDAALLQGISDRSSQVDPDGQINPRIERLNVENIPLPDDDPVMLPNTVPHHADAALIDGVTVSLLGVGGPGEAEYNFKTSHSGHSTHSTSDNIQAEFRPPNATLSIDNDRRHIVLKVEGDTIDHQVVLLLTDQNGVQIKTDSPRQMNEVRVWLFDVDEWTTAINAYITVQRARNVEFTVAPPQPLAAE